MSSSASRTGGGGTRTGSRTTSTADAVLSAATAVVTSIVSSATGGGKHGASGTSSSAASTSTAKAKNTTQDPAKTLQKWMEKNYPLFQWWLIGAMGGLVMFLYIAALIRGYLRRRAAKRASGIATTDAEPKDGEVVETGRQGVPSYRNLPTAVSTMWHKLLYRITIPTSLDRTQRMQFAEAIFCGGWLLSCLMFGFINSDAGPNSFANRTGWLVFAQTPFIVGLAGKNNVISYCTGIGPEKLNILHRAAGRSALILSLTHTFTWVYMGISSKHAVTTWTGMWGVIAMVAFFLTWLLSFRFVRRLCYEFFLISHIILICLFLVGCALHKESAAYWIYPSMALWASDRLARVIRMVLLNRLWLSALPSSAKEYTRATIESLPNDTVRITMNRKMGWRAGQHAYLVVPGVSLFPWEAHPFTIASAPTPKSSRVAGEDKNEHELTFIVRARDGFTKRLKARANKEGGQANVVAFVDGAYGIPPDLLQYNTVVLIGGGSGISYTFSQLSQIIQYHPIRASAVKRVCFVWVIRQHANIAWIGDALADLLTLVPSGLDVEIKIYVTHTVALPPTLPILQSEPTEMPEPKGKDSSSSSIKSSLSSTEISGTTSPEQPLSRFVQVKIRDGRPDVPALIKEEVDASHGPVGVSVCGPSSLTRTVRSTLAKKEIASWSGAMRGRPEVDLHVEQFGW